MASGSGARAAKKLSPEKSGPERKGSLAKQGSQAERLKESALGAPPAKDKGKANVSKPAAAVAKAKEAVTAGGPLAAGFSPSAVSEPLALKWSGGDGEWTAACDLGDVHVSTRGAGSRVALFLHGADSNRSAASWANYWPMLEGLAVIAIDMPGHGLSGAANKAAAADGAEHQLVIAVLQSFAAPEALGVVEGGGASLLVRAYLAAPKLFGTHHTLLNPGASRTNARRPVATAHDRSRRHSLLCAVRARPAAGSSARG